MFRIPHRKLIVVLIKVSCYQWFWSSSFELSVGQVYPIPYPWPIACGTWLSTWTCMYKPYVLIDCEQSLSFPCLLEITEFFSWRARNYWNMRSVPIPSSFLSIGCITYFEFLTRRISGTKTDYSKSNDLIMSRRKFMRYWMKWKPKHYNPFRRFNQCKSPGEPPE